MTTSLLVLNGPNLNLLGPRQPQVYGSTTFADVEALCRQGGEWLGVGIDFRQSNQEGVVIDWIHEAKEKHAGITFNADALTHTPMAIIEVIASAELPVAEVHLSTSIGARRFSICPMSPRWRRE